MQLKSFVLLNRSSNLIGSSSDASNFPHKLLLTNANISKIFKAFANSFLVKTKLNCVRRYKLNDLLVNYL